MKNNPLDVNTFIVCGRPKFYSLKEYKNERGTYQKFSIAIELAGLSKYLWVSVGLVGPDNDKKAPFTKEEFEKAEYVTITDLAMDSYIDKQGTTKYGTKCSGKSVLLGLNLNANVGWCFGRIANISEPNRKTRVKLPYLHKKVGSSDKPTVEHKMALVKWIDSGPMPKVDQDVLILASVKTLDDGTPYLQAGRVA